MEVVECACNIAALEAEFLNGVDSIAVEGNSLSIGERIVWPPVILRKDRGLNKNKDIIET